MIQQQEKVKLRHGFKKWSDEKSVSIRKELGLYAFSPLSAFDLCKHLNIIVLSPNQVAGMSEAYLNNLLGVGSGSWSAATVPINDDKHLIVHNTTHSLARQQSNLMHELAHIICGHKISEDIRNTGLASFLRCHDADQENEAEWFGACLQLPRPALLYSLKKKMTVEDIADYYNSSIEMTKYRINITGVNKQISYFR